MIPTNHKTYVIAAWCGTALLAATLVPLLLGGQWLDATLLAGFLGMSAALLILPNGLPSLFDLLLVIAALINAAGWVWEIYDAIPGYDEFAHFYTTFAVTLALGLLVYKRVSEPFREHRTHFVLVIASFGISIGAFWEIFEWVVLKKLTNPVVDLMMDSLGAVAAGLVAAWFLGLRSREDSRA
jgi:VanZ family protein